MSGDWIDFTGLPERRAAFTAALEARGSAFRETDQAVAVVMDREGRPASGPDATAFLANLPPAKGPDLNALAGLLTIVDLGGQRELEPAVVPDLDDSGAVLFEPGEQMLWRGGLDLRCTRRPVQGGNLATVWVLPTSGDVIVTDRRITFTCAKYDVGSTWHTGIIPRTSLTLTAASHLRAQQRRKGHMAAGMIRWDWPASIRVELTKAPIGSTLKASVIFRVQVGGRFVMLVLAMGKDRESAVQMQRMIAQAVARYRLATVLDDDQTRTALQAIADDPASAEESTETGLASYISLPAGMKVPLRREPLPPPPPS